jgi:hypothetical protein
LHYYLVLIYQVTANLTLRYTLDLLHSQGVVVMLTGQQRTKPNNPPGITAARRECPSVYRRSYAASNSVTGKGVAMRNV